MDARPWGVKERGMFRGLDGGFYIMYLSLSVLELTVWKPLI